MFNQTHIAMNAVAMFIYTVVTFVLSFPFVLLWKLGLRFRNKVTHFLVNLCYLERNVVSSYDFEEGYERPTHTVNIFKGLRIGSFVSWLTIYGFKGFSSYENRANFRFLIAFSLWNSKRTVDIRKQFSFGFYYNLQVLVTLRLFKLYACAGEKVQYYGGPEEGGWYGHDFEIHESKRVYTIKPDWKSLFPTYNFDRRDSYGQGDTYQLMNKPEHQYGSRQYC